MSLPSLFVCHTDIINSIINKNKTINKEMTEIKKNKDIYYSFNTFENLDKSEIRSNKKVREKINNNNTLESFCYYKILDKYFKLLCLCGKQIRKEATYGW